MEKELPKVINNEVGVSFKDAVQKLEKAMINIADGVNVFGDGKNVVSDQCSKMKHLFVDGIYIREQKMEKGLLIIGCIHKYSHVWFLLDGKIAIATENGSKEYEGPVYFTTEPGIKRAGYVIEDCTFINIHANPSNTQDLKELENNLIAFSYEEYEEFLEEKNKNNN